MENNFLPSLRENLNHFINWLENINTNINNFKILEDAIDEGIEILLKEIGE